jgi:hypothetical protein
MELQRLTQDTKLLETAQGAKNRLDDRDEWRENKDEAIGEKCVTPSPPPPRHIQESERTRTEPRAQTKKEELESFKNALDEKRTAKAQRAEVKKEEGRARQAKAEQRTEKQCGYGHIYEITSAGLYRRTGQQEMLLPAESGDNLKTTFRKGCTPTYTWKITQGRLTSYSVSRMA